MIVKPKLSLSYNIVNDSADFIVRPIASRPSDGLFIECEVVDPPSSKGRNVTLWIDPDTADAMLRAVKEHAIERRK